MASQLPSVALVKVYFNAHSSIVRKDGSMKEAIGEKLEVFFTSCLQEEKEEEELSVGA